MKTKSAKKMFYNNKQVKSFQKSLQAGINAKLKINQEYLPT